MNRFKKIIQDKNVKKITKNSGIIISGGLVWSALNLISFAIMSRQLGPESLAILILAQTYSLIINDIFNIQTWESMIKFGAEKIESTKILDIIITNLLLDIISAIVAFILALVLLRPVAYFFGWDDSFLSIISIYTLSILFNITTFTIGIPRLFDKFTSIAILQICTAFLKLSLVVCALLFSNTLMIYVYIYLFADICMNLSIIIYSLVLLKVNYGTKWWKRQLDINKEQLVFIWWTNLRTIVRIPVRHFDMIVISSVLSLEMVGIYKVYKDVAGMIGRIGEPITQAIFPEFSKLIAKKRINKTIDTTKKSILLLFSVSAIITLAMLIMSNIIIGKFFGEEYLANITIFRILVIFFGVHFVILPINPLFIAAGYAKYNFLIILVTNSIYLIMVYCLGRLIGIYGVVIAFVIQLLLNHGLKIFLLQKHKNEWG